MIQRCSAGSNVELLNFLFVAAKGPARDVDVAYGAFDAYTDDIYAGMGPNSSGTGAHQAGYPGAPPEAAPTSQTRSAWDTPVPTVRPVFFSVYALWVARAWCGVSASLSNSCTGQLMRAVVLCRSESGDNGFGCVFMQAFLLQSSPAWASSTTMKAAMEPIQFTESTANPRSPTSRAHNASNAPVGNNTPAPSVPAGPAPWYTLRGYCTYFDVDTGVRVSRYHLLEL